jgi:hypothetical protein
MMAGTTLNKRLDCSSREVLGTCAREPVACAKCKLAVLPTLTLTRSLCSALACQIDSDGKSTASRPWLPTILISDSRIFESRSKSARTRVLRLVRLSTGDLCKEEARPPYMHYARSLSRHLFGFWTLFIPFNRSFYVRGHIPLDHLTCTASIHRTQT